jgi:hypothetical protein
VVDEGGMDELVEHLEPAVLEQVGKDASRGVLVLI